ncbi:MAG: permease [Marinobacter sp.]|uniref:permease n=1 Tax=Marinobacter sp. TaxID=50741 RepID=UPI0034A050FA
MSVIAYLKRELLDRSTLFFIVLALVAGGALWWLQGEEAFEIAATSSGVLVLLIAPIILIAMIISCYVRELIPTAVIERWLGSESGLRGLAVAVLGGAVTPGGPFAAFPLVVGFYRSGASFEICVAYLTSWAVLGLNRVLIWELPFLGFDFVLLRLLISLPLPVIAWMLAKFVTRRRNA